MVLESTLSKSVCDEAPIPLILLTLAEWDDFRSLPKSLGSIPGEGRCFYIFSSALLVFTNCVMALYGGIYSGMFPDMVQYQKRKIRSA